MWCSRLGPLSIEQKIRTTNKRSKQSKEDYKEEKPVSMKNDDIHRSENETTKNVLVVRHLMELVARIIPKALTVLISFNTSSNVPARLTYSAL
jgi:hypothetical protein